MKRYVDADEMIEDTDSMRVISDGIAIDGIIKYINENATADVEEVRHGKWRDEREDFGTYVCSVCNRPCGNQYNYCPNCGAKMDGKETK